MLNWLRAYWPAVMLALTMLAVVDGTLSSLLTCHPVGTQTGGGANQEQTKEYCTALSGPLLTSLRLIAETSHKYEGLITATFTVVLAIFTGRLWYSTEGLFRVTKTVADADRPHMIPSEMTISGIRNAAENGFISARLEYKFINYGRSPAFMRNYSLVIKIGEAELDPIPDYGTVTQTNHIIVVNGWWGTTDVDPATIRLAETDVAGVLNGASIEYGDTASQMHKMRFAYHFIFNEGDRSVQFRPIGPDSYREYT